MSTTSQLYNYFNSRLLSKKAKLLSEKIIVYIAIISFIVHLSFIALAELNFIQLPNSNLLNSPIAAIYTPFTFILIYEVYLLIYYLPKSITTYIGKQYEIITLILMRRLFKDLSNLELTSEWFQIKNDLQFTFDLLATLVLFFLIYLFYKLRDEVKSTAKPSKPITKFIKMKKVIAMLLIVLFVTLALFHLISWIYDSYFSLHQIVNFRKDINKIFFDEFFTVLILTDVLLLLLSFAHTDKFNKVVRNSGFIISTILIRLSFGVDGLLNTILITVAVLFGVVILIIHNKYTTLSKPYKKT
jgi:cell division protein FtsL